MKNHKCDCMSQGPALLPVRYAVVPEYIQEALPAWAKPVRRLIRQKVKIITMRCVRCAGVISISTIRT